MQSESNRVHLRKNVISPEAFTKNEDDIDAERTIINTRIAQLTANLNSPMYREQAIDPTEIEAEYAEFADPKRMDLETEHGRDTIRQYLDLFGVRVEVRSDGEPVWHCEGFDDQNRYS